LIKEIICFVPDSIAFDPKAVSYHFNPSLLMIDRIPDPSSSSLAIDHSLKAYMASIHHSCNIGPFKLAAACTSFAANLHSSMDSCTFAN